MCSVFYGFKSVQWYIAFNIFTTIIMVFNMFSTAVFLNKFCVIIDFTVSNIVMIGKMDFLLITYKC